MRGDAPSAQAIIIAYLARQSRYVCERCLARVLNISVAAAIQATVKLEKSPAFKLRFYWCALCQRRERVIRIDRPRTAHLEHGFEPEPSTAGVLGGGPPAWTQYRAPLLPAELLRLQKLGGPGGSLGRLG